MTDVDGFTNCRIELEVLYNNSYGPVVLTAITDNAALTYLGSLIEGISAASPTTEVRGGKVSVLVKSSPRSSPW